MSTPTRNLVTGRRRKVSQTLYRRLRQASVYPSSTIYNLTISDKAKFVWFRVAKVGTRTIRNHLRTHAGRLSLEAGSLYYPVNAYADYFKFGFVRNPWSRLVSCWLNKVVENQHQDLFGFDAADFERYQDFGEFVGFVESLDLETCDRHLRLQCHLIDLNHVDFVGRLESFDEDFAHVCRRLSLPARNVVKQNVSSTKKPYQAYYTGELRDRVTRLYERDIQIFGYAFPRT